MRDWDATDPYDLSDFAGDLLKVIEATDKEKVHLVGISMGGMISQQFALEYPERLHSLTSLSSTAFFYDPDLVGLSTFIKMHMARLEISYSKEIKDQLMRRLETVSILRNKAPLPHDIALMTAQKGMFNFIPPRGSNPAATDRHIKAIEKSGSRIESLKNLKIPTLVMHGTEDPLVLFEHGKKTAETIPGAKFVSLEGMGHIIPEDHTPTMVAEIHQHVQQNLNN